MSEKDSVIRGVYYDVVDGFSSVADTYKQAKKILNTITIDDVKDFLNRQKSRQTKPYRGFNSYVAPQALHEIQCDLMDMTASASINNGYRYAFLAIDVFSKYIWAVPVKDKRPQESIRAFKEVLGKIGKPVQIMTDREGAWESKEFVTLLNENKIKHIISSAPPPFSERAVKEIKNMIHARLGGLEMEAERWVDVLPAVLKKYNTRIHGSTGMSPDDARKDKNSIEVFLNIRQKAQFKRRYPDLKVNDMVRTIVKRHTFTKGYNSGWSSNVYKILHVSDDGKQYLINDGKKKVYNRWELLKIEGAEGKDG